MRWPVLQDRARMKIENFSKFMLTCCGLHNFLINTGEEVFENVEELLAGGIVEQEYQGGANGLPPTDYTVRDTFVTYA